MPFRITTAQKVKDFSFKKPSDTSNDDVLNSLIEWVGAEFESHCNRKFMNKSREALFNPGENYYFVNAFPIQRDSSGNPIVTVTVEGNSRTINDDYYVNEALGLIEFKYAPLNVTPWSVKIVWEGGWTAFGSDNLLDHADGSTPVDVPGDIIRACVLQVSFEFDRRRTLGQASISLPDGSESRQERIELLPGVKDILKKYKMPAGAGGLAEDITQQVVADS